MSVIITILSVLNLAAVIILFTRLKSNRPDLNNKFEQLEKIQERIEKSVKDEIFRNRDEQRQILKIFEDSLLSRMRDNENSQKNHADTFLKQFSSLTIMNEEKLEKVRHIVEERLELLQKENREKLDKMREVVDEKLHATLEKRLSSSFQIVNDRLESVYKGLGEMQMLASDVGDLKKVLTNVKTRGTWGEIQLGMLLEQILTSQQYDKNVETRKNSNERVEFAVKLPGKDDDADMPVWLPIDAKFPQEDYQRLVSAQETAKLEEIEKNRKQLEIRIKAEARDIRDKYLNPPATTDFAIMYLPTEGLFAEVLNRDGLFEYLQREYKIVVTGPTTLAALLNSLQMGFKTLAIQKRSSEVWRLLAAVKQQFGKFGVILDKTQKKLSEASNTIEEAAKKSRTIEKRLNKVEEMPKAGELEAAREMIEVDALENDEQIEDVFVGNEDRS
jgi:DNA recombination protein RmuC